MTRVFQDSHLSAKGPHAGKRAGYECMIMLALVLIASAVPLQAQSDSGLLSALPNPSPRLDIADGLGVGACSFVFAPKFQSRPIAGGFESVGSDTSVRSSGTEPSINGEKSRSQGESWAGSSSSQQGDPSYGNDADDCGAGDNSRGSSKAPSALIAEHTNRSDRNLDIYYRNRREFGLDVGWHPINIPFIYDFAVGDSYNMTPLKYTLVPIIASLRWHVTNVGWKWIFRGNMDFTFSGALTVIPRGPETHYYSFDFGIRRNFVYRNWKVVPFFEQRGGAGIINAKEPLGVLFAQGQNLTFTYNMGAGLRYNIDSKYSFSAGMNYMHISNGYLSEPQFYNYGINVYGPMFGLDVRLGKPRHSISQSNEGEHPTF